jgi:radical SAM superfamily enzyme
MYRGVQFSTETIEQVEQDLIEAKKMYGSVKRIFLVNGDAFVLSYKRLKPIAELIIKYFPMVEVITMYASINNIKSKTDQELLELGKLRINELWVGLETGNAETLDYYNKGFNIDDSYEQMPRLNKAGIRHIDIFILGGAGKGKGIINAQDTAKLINHSKPMAIATTTMGAFGDSQLAKDVEAGIFTPATEREVLEEQKLLLDLIEVPTSYLGIHAINTVPFDAELPKQKKQAIAAIDKVIAQLDADYLDSVPERHSI